jgi:hypothetical protein
MEEEVFEAYKAERVELRKSIVAELESSSNNDDNVNTDEDSEENASDDTTNAELENEEDATTNLEGPIEPMKAVAAALNLEILPSDDLLSKYKELGKAMAKKYERKSE